MWMVVIDSDESKGNILNWTLSSWNSTNMEQESIEVIRLCHDDVIGNVIIAGDYTIESGYKLCKQIGGKPAVVESSSGQDELMDIFSSHHYCSSKGKTVFVKQNASV